MLQGIGVQEDNQISNREDDRMVVKELTEERPPTRRRGTGRRWRIGRRWGCRPSCGVLAAEERKASGVRAKGGEGGQFPFFCDDRAMGGAANAVIFLLVEHALFFRWEGLRTR